MDDVNDDDTLEFWEQVAGDWEVQVGEEGDLNRRLNSDPVLWRLAGDVNGLCVLDAGCGTGYLSRKLAASGARVVGVDFSPKMIAIARAASPDIDFRVDSCSELTTLRGDSIDLIVSNYVLMDTPDLDAAMHAFSRVLHSGGIAVLIFSHPCFPQGSARGEGERCEYFWGHSYFEERKRIDPPWGHFTSEFIWFHRPLSHYFRAFAKAGFGIVEFDEPHVTRERYHLAGSAGLLEKFTTRPMSVAFKLQLN